MYNHNVCLIYLYLILYFDEDCLDIMAFNG